MAFIMRNLHKIQAGRGVNSPGTPEIPPAVFEELLVNALVHRDYLVSAAIRIFIFDNRIEIINPGHLPNNLTVEKIKEGNSNIRNPILVSFVAKGLLPYHGLGSGINRALENWPDIDFIDDQEGCLFKAIVRRKAVAVKNIVQGSPESSPKSSPETGDAILDLVRGNARIAALERKVADLLEKKNKATETFTAASGREGRLKKQLADVENHMAVLVELANKVTNEVKPPRNITEPAVRAVYLAIGKIYGISKIPGAYVEIFRKNMPKEIINWGGAPNQGFDDKET